VPQIFAVPCARVFLRDFAEERHPRHISSVIFATEEDQQTGRQLRDKVTSSSTGLINDADARSGARRFRSLISSGVNASAASACRVERLIIVNQKLRQHQDAERLEFFNRLRSVICAVISSVLSYGEATPTTTRADCSPPGCGKWSASLSGQFR
jgi:hypothetical protein